MTSKAQQVVLLLMIPFCTGCFASAGPVFGYALDRGGTLGWEASAGHWLAHGVVGHTRRPQAKQGHEDLAADATVVTEEMARAFDDEGVTYFAIEPWFWVGATLGVAMVEGHKYASGAFGLWEGGAVPAVAMAAVTGKDFMPVFSLAAGVRWLDGVAELYLTPKLGMMWDDGQNYGMD